MTSPQDRRTDARFSLHVTGSAVALYRRTPDAGRQDRFKAETINVSRGGMMVAFDPDLSIGDVIRVALLHPVTRDELLFEVQIQWLRRNATPLMGKYCAGVSFKQPGDAVIDTLMAHAAAVNAPPAP